MANPRIHAAAATQNAHRESQNIQLIKEKVHRQFLASLDFDKARRIPADQLQTESLEQLDRIIDEQQCPLSVPEKQRLLREVMDEVFGLGPLEEFLRDPTISDILVNGAFQIYIERKGKMLDTNVRFRDNDHLMHIIQRIGSSVGRRIDDSSPTLDGRLIDGSRVNAIIPPLSLSGPILSIRRFANIAASADTLIQLETLTGEMAVFLQACVRSKMNILISGGTGTGKTTLLNVISRWIPEHERLITIEDAAELQLQQNHVVRLETRPSNVEGKGEITQRDLLRNSLRMRPDRIIIGEVRGAETYDMLQAMNTGHEGSMTTVHANSPRDALRRIENMTSMAGLNYSVRVIREQTSSALNLLVHLNRVTGGKRKITHIAEITGMEGDTICLHDLFVYQQSGVDSQGHAVGSFRGCGVRPHLMNRILAEGIQLPENLFQNRILTENEYQDLAHESFTAAK